MSARFFYGKGREYHCAILEFIDRREDFLNSNDSILNEEMPQSVSFNSGIRNDSDWAFFLGATGNKNHHGNKSYYEGQKYFKRITKEKS